MQEKHALWARIKHPIVILSSLLGLTLLSLYLYPSFPVHWDSFDYLAYSTTNTPSRLFFGRTGFIGLYHYLYNVISPANPMEYHVPAVVLGTFVTFCMYFLFLKFLYKQNLDILKFFLFSFFCLSYPVHHYGFSQVLPDPFMLSFGFLGLILFDHYDEKKNYSYLLLGILAIVVGVTFKEIILYFLAYPILRSKRILNRPYMCALVLLLLLVMGVLLISPKADQFPEYKALISPVLDHLKLNRVEQWGAVFTKLTDIIRYMAGKLPFFYLLIPGGCLIYWKKNHHINWNLILRILFVSLPCFYFLLIYPQRKPDYERYTFVLILSLLVAYFESISIMIKTALHSKSRIAQQASIVTIISCLLLYNIIQSQDSYLRNSRKSWLFQYVYSVPLNAFNTLQAAIAPGPFSSLLHYHNQVYGLNHKIIWSGWSWKDGGRDYFEDHLSSSLLQGQRVFVINDDYLTESERNDVRSASKRHEVTIFNDFFREISLANQDERR